MTLAMDAVCRLFNFRVTSSLAVSAQIFILVFGQKQSLLLALVLATTIATTAYACWPLVTRTPWTKSAFLTFSLGGLGMLIGAQIDLAVLGAHAHHHSTLVNYATAVMLLFCIPGCCFGCDLTAYKNMHKVFIHTTALVLMVAGMMLGMNLLRSLGISEFIWFADHTSMLVGMTLGQGLGLYLACKLTHHINHLHSESLIKE